MLPTSSSAVHTTSGNAGTQNKVGFKTGVIVGVMLALGLLNVLQQLYQSSRIILWKGSENSSSDHYLDQQNSPTQMIFASLLSSTKGGEDEEAPSSSDDDDDDDDWSSRDANDDDDNPFRRYKQAEKKKQRKEERRKQKQKEKQNAEDAKKKQHKVKGELASSAAATKQGKKNPSKKKNQKKKKKNKPKKDENAESKKEPVRIEWSLPSREQRLSSRFSDLDEIFSGNSQSNSNNTAPRIIQIRDDEWRNQGFRIRNNSDSVLRLPTDALTATASSTSFLDEYLDLPLLDIIPDESDDSEEEYEHDGERHFYEDCEPITSLPKHPTCNDFHTIDISAPNIIPLGEGGWRSAWRYQHQHSNSTNATTNDNVIILKLLNYLDRRPFETYVYDMHALDNAVMERLTSSPYSISAFGECGPSTLTEVAESIGSFMRDDHDNNNNSTSFSISSLNKLEMATHLVWGLAELHSLQPMQDLKRQADAASSTNSTITTNPHPLVFAHFDVKYLNVVHALVRNQGRTKFMLQWNDYNLSYLLRRFKNATTTTMCNVPVGYFGLMERSPEIVMNPKGQVNGTMADVYMLGNVLYQILAEQRPYQQERDRTDNPLYPNQTLDGDTMRATKLKGVLPYLPERFYQPPLNNDLAAQTLWKAIQACFRLNPDDRPTAFDLAVSLSRAYQRIRQNATLTEQDLSQLFPNVN